uniref:ribosomal protein S19 n=1 Tax=Polymyxa betae TaxID=41456 RepID=UPI001D0FC393|nr:ribosomal protein S19 [Polymyxa betae]CAG9644882.1 ribosomal protein S19 [Polymyxa betae]
MRSTWKGPYITQKIYTNLLQTNKKIFYLKKKNNVILPEFIGLKIKVYNGKKFFDMQVTPSMVGYKFGAFIFTRKLHVFKTKR